MKKELAIVIPAYKVDFLESTLKSFARQTNQDFNLYIGDDASPHNIKSIVDKFPNDNFIYHRFSENMGGKDLVAHWNRCVELTDDEKWIWLFSDDDVVDENCVAEFMSKPRDETNLYHFNVSTIDENDNELENCSFPMQVMSQRFFLKNRLTYKLKSFVVEYIFSRKVFDKYGGFQNFDLAWCSDDATWIAFCGDGNIETIDGATVYWRSSHVNITPNRSEQIAKRKFASVLAYSRWISTHITYWQDLRMEVYIYILHSMYHAVQSGSSYSEIKRIIVAHNAWKEVCFLRNPFMRFVCYWGLRFF